MAVLDSCAICTTALDMRTCYLCAKITLASGCDHYQPAESLCQGHTLKEISRFMESGEQAKVVSCEWCCGCPECMEHHRGGWTPKDSGVQVRHGGAWDRVTRYAAPSPGDTPRSGGSTLSSGGTAPDPGQP